MGFIRLLEGYNKFEQIGHTAISISCLQFVEYLEHHDPIAKQTISISHPVSFYFDNMGNPEWLSTIDCNILRAEFYYYHELAEMGVVTIPTF